VGNPEKPLPEEKKGKEKLRKASHLSVWRKTEKATYPPRHPLRRKDKELTPYTSRHKFINLRYFLVLTY